MKKIIILLLVITATRTAAQTVTGVIKNSDAKPLQGATVQISPGNKTMATDTLGRFSFTVVPGTKTTLRFSYTGMGDKDTTFIASNNGTTMAITMEEARNDLDEVVIVASSRTNSRIEDLPTKVEVLGAEEVHEENGIKPGNIASLLGDIAGIQIQQTNAATGNADMRIQGLQGKYTQLLRDGMPLYGGYAGSFSILQIPPLDLQQIELVKGAASTLYGGGAIAGMVNLVSKKPKMSAPERSLTVNRSTLGENNLNMFFSGRNQNTGYTLFAGGTYQRQADVDKDGFSDVPAVKSVFVHPRVFLYGGTTSTVTLGYTLNYEDRNGGDMLVLDGNASAAHSFFIRNKTMRNTGDIAWEKKLDNNAMLTAKASASFSDRDINVPGFEMRGNQVTWYSEIAYSRKTEKNNWVTGINYNGDDFKSHATAYSALPNEASNTLGFFAQDDWRFAKAFTLQAGLRVDVNSVYSGFVLPRLSLMYKLNSKLTMRIGGGFGYKPPTLFNTEVDEREYRYIAGYAANTKAEHSFGGNYDLNYKTKAGDWDLTCNQTFFYNSVRDPILLYPNNPGAPAYYYANVGGSLKSVGSETYIQAIKDPWELYLGYVYTDARRSYSPNKHLPLIAPHKFATVIAYEFGSHFRVGIESAYTGKQYLDNGQTTMPYLFTAVMIRYNVGKAAFVLNCENLFDYRQNKNSSIVQGPVTNPTFPEIWAPLDGRVVNLSMYVKF